MKSTRALLLSLADTIGENDQMSAIDIEAEVRNNTGRLMGALAHHGYRQIKSTMFGFEVPVHIRVKWDDLQQQSDTIAEATTAFINWLAQARQ
jgi:hypothetical protein